MIAHGLNAAITCSTVCTTMPLKRWLSSLLRPILSVLGMSDTSWAYLEFPSTPIVVENWERQLVDKYSTSDDAYNHMNDIRVLKIAHYKSTVRLEHEYLMATIKEKQGQRRSLQLERSLSPQQESHHSDVEGLDGGKAVSAGGQKQSRSSGGSLQDLRCVEPIISSAP
jgi:hypothetical protein